MKRIGIIRGGSGEDYQASLQKGAEIFSFIEKNIGERWKPIDIFIDRAGTWHIGGLPIVPADLYHRVDIFWNNATPEVNAILDSLGFPHISTPAFSASLGKSRAMLEEHMKQSGVSMPMHFVLPAYQEDFDGSIERYATVGAKSVFEKFGAPWIVKSLGEKNSMGVHVSKTYPELVNAIIDGAEHGGSIIVEELITGSEASMHSLKNFRGEDTYIFPGQFRGPEKDALHDLVQNLHQSTGSNYLKSHFVINPNRGIFLKHLEFTPDFGNDSDLHNVSRNIGVSASHILESILENNKLKL